MKQYKEFFSNIINNTWADLCDKGATGINGMEEWLSEFGVKSGLSIINLDEKWRIMTQ